MDVLARMEAKIDRLGERVGGLEDGQRAFTARVGNVEDNLLRPREVGDPSREVADETLRLVDSKLELLRLDMLQAVDVVAKSEWTHARTLATAQLDALRGEIDALAQRVELLERSRG